MTDLQSSVWRELKAGHSIDIYRCNLQKVYAEKLISILTPTLPVALTAGFSGNGFRYHAGLIADVRKYDIIWAVRAWLISLESSKKTSIPRQTDNISRYHLSDVLARINNALNPKRG